MCCLPCSVFCFSGANTKQAEDGTKTADWISILKKWKICLRGTRFAVEQVGWGCVVPSCLGWVMYPGRSPHHPLLPRTNKLHLFSTPASWLLANELNPRFDFLPRGPERSGSCSGYTASQEPLFLFFSS